MTYPTIPGCAYILAKLVLADPERERWHYLAREIIALDRANYEAGKARVERLIAESRGA